MDSAGLEAKVRDFFDRNDHNLVAAYLFGSYARGNASESSDVDIAILYPGKVPHTLDAIPTHLIAELEALLGKPVDLVILNHAPADLVHRVLRDGHLVLERDRASRVRFEVRMRNQYFDLLPFLERYRRFSSRRRSSP